MRNLVITTSDTKKGRSFSALQIACVEADSLWEGGRTSTDTVRPVWMMLAGSEIELRSFVANLRGGRKAEVGNGYRSRGKEKVEFLKSVGYQFTWQRMPEGSVVTVFLPDLFRLDPGMVDPKGIQFVVLPTKEYISTQTIDIATAETHSRGLFKLPADIDFTQVVPTAALFCAYLDRRTRCPLLVDSRFYTQLYLACLEKGLASWSHESYSYCREFGQNSRVPFLETDTDKVGLLPGVAFQANHEDFEKVLAEEVKRFFDVTGSR